MITFLNMVFRFFLRRNEKLMNDTSVALSYIAATQHCLNHEFKQVAAGTTRFEPKPRGFTAGIWGVSITVIKGNPCRMTVIAKSQDRAALALLKALLVNNRNTYGADVIMSTPELLHCTVHCVSKEPAASRARATKN